MSEPGNSNKPNLFFEAYKLIAEDLSRCREQRDRTTRGYITINSVIVAASGVVHNQAVLDIGWRTLVTGALLLAGVTVSLQWVAATPRYNYLLKVRSDALEEREKEQRYDLPKVFTNSTSKEISKALDVPMRRAPVRWMAQLIYLRHDLLPKIFLLLYLVLLIYLIVELVSLFV